MCIPQSFVAVYRSQRGTIQFECLKMNGSMRLSERFATFCCKSIQSTPEQIRMDNSCLHVEKPKNLFPMSIKKDAHYSLYCDPITFSLPQIKCDVGVFFVCFSFACWFIHSCVIHLCTISSHPLDFMFSD